MSSRKGGKAKPGAGKALKNPSQLAKKAPNRSAPSKGPNTSASKKSNKPDSGNSAADQSTLPPVNDLQEKSAIIIQCACRQYLARKERIKRLKAKENYEELMEQLQREAFVALVKREQEAAAREREKEEKERKLRQEEQKRRTRMLEAAFDGDVDEMKALLNEVSDLDSKNRIGNDEMGKVIRRRHQLALIDCTDAHGNTPLSEASGGGHPEAIRFLIEKGANLNSKGAYGRTPLYRAAFGGHLAALEMLLQYGGDPRICADDGIIPEEIASTDAVIKILHEWDISTTVALVEKMASERQRISAAEKKLKLEETNRIQNQVSEITKELAQYQHELQKAYCELNKRITEHDKCVRKNMSKTDITLQAIHDAEELLAEKRAAVARAEDKLSFAKLELREKLQREASLTKPIGALCHIRELDDVLLKDIGDKIKQDGRWPLIIDRSGQASTFLRYRDTNFYDALNPGHMQPEVLRLGLLGAIRFLSLIRPGDGPEYSRNEFSPARTEKFQMVFITKLQNLPEELLTIFYPIQIVIK
ncbi:IQ motif and ankyrin repeat domain-containing protein 1-like isoform X2 [Stegostoma tigrinum]|uniref:IQ motif and ankyrin repeat domain-containing protein 1-like isoform X2 n=1 Tax=Stegostoma tigrinum TaxID=3053191 RepID=UPI0028706588|nr:IQ motif and ankyrin repeat domain-containing protein 1-like isoform X2 [Stegostoma tigrinum]